MKKKIVSMLLISVMGLGLLTACGDKKQDNKEDENKTGNGTVTLTVSGAVEDQELLKKLCSEFTAANSDTTFEIKFVELSEGDARSYVLDNVAGAPDVFAFADDQLASFAASGVIDPVVNASDISNANVEGSVSAATVNGTLYAYPMTADNGFFMFYDKSVFQEADLATLDGMLAAAQKGGKQIFMDITSGWYNYAFFGNSGLTVGLNDDGISNFCTWNSTENAITGVQVLEAMIAVCQSAGFTKDTGLSLVDGARSGQYCAGVSGVWDVATLAEIWGDNLGATKLPTYTVAGQQLQMSSFAGYKLIGVNAYSANREWAHKLAEWLTNEQSQMTRFSMRALGPSNKNASASKEVSASIAIKALNLQAPYSTLQRIGGTYWGPAGDIGNLALQNNPKGLDLQTFLDTCVESITKSNGQ